MGSSSKKRQTMAKMTRERMVKEKRALKQEKKDAKKLAAAGGTPFGETGDLEAADDSDEKAPESTFPARIVPG